MKSPKNELHPRNRHVGRYDFLKLKACTPCLKKFVFINEFGNETIDFTNPSAIKALNQALLKFFYDLDWDLPENYLCPPIPGRADYIHYVADLIGGRKGKEVRVLDIGVGANGIYPLIGTREYGWSFVGTDIMEASLTIAQDHITRNKLKTIELRHQKNPTKIFDGILKENEKFDVTLCNPPFHSSRREAEEGTSRKWNNLKVKTKVLNFGGQNNELWCKGGEVAFITRMIEESVRTPSLWFTTLVAKSSHLPLLYTALEKVKAKQVKTIEMGQGQKKSRLLAWSFY